MTVAENSELQASGNAPIKLSLRQRQILELLRAGKANKEIAFELGIGVGTVKQHVVALFRKLKVRNRAMAVSAGPDKGRGQRWEGGMRATDSVLERRPCLVLALSLAGVSDAAAIRGLHGAMAALAHRHGALFLTRQGCAGDVIFGVEMVREDDLLTALQGARQVAEALAAAGIKSAVDLRGGLAAGLAVASMYRSGGWTGEALASGAIARCRQMVQTAAASTLLLDESSRRVLRIFGVGGGREIPAAFAFADPAPFFLKPHFWSAHAPVRHAVPRRRESAELARLLDDSAVAAGRRIVRLSSPAGGGKSRLCADLAADYRRRGMAVTTLNCLPAGIGYELLDCDRNQPLKLAALPDLLTADYDLTIIDETHRLSPDAAQAISVHLAAAAGPVLLAERRQKPLPLAVVCSELELPPLSSGQAMILADEHLRSRVRGTAQRRRLVRNIVAVSDGNPLLISELARHGAELAVRQPGGPASGRGSAEPGQERGDCPELPPALLFWLAAAIDPFGLDRRLLRLAALEPAGISIAEIASALGEPSAVWSAALERAVTSGILRRSESDTLAFTHPALRTAVNSLSMES